MEHLERLELMGERSLDFLPLLSSTTLLLQIKTLHFSQSPGVPALKNIDPKGMSLTFKWRCFQTKIVAKTKDVFFIFIYIPSRKQCDSILWSTVWIAPSTSTTHNANGSAYVRLEDRRTPAESRKSFPDIWRTLGCPQKSNWTSRKAVINKEGLIDYFSYRNTYCWINFSE